ncbi:EAL domain-containing protein [Paucibacter sp. JuS9]|uniref:bifunctional diguanylate cyclase/phosphodiesterase n=1 Tax=Roseateles TaxID=93681 RepID=UPI002FE5CFAE
MNKPALTAPAFDANQAAWHQARWICGAAAALMVGALALPRISLFAQRPADHASVHLLLEMFAVVVSVMVASMAWHAAGRQGAGKPKLLLYGFTVVAGVDLFHAISFDGMPSLLSDAGTAKAIFFWLCGRTIEVVTVLLVAARLEPPGRRGVWLALAVLTIAVLFLVGTFRLDALPTIFVVGTGVTPFKARLEYVLLAANLAAGAWLFLRSRSEEQPRLIWLATACVVTGIGELAFTTYVATSDFLNLFGHLYKLLSYSLIYRAVFYSSVQEPYALLERAEQLLQKRNQELDAILKNVPVTIVQLDRELRLSYANPAYASQVGLGVVVCEGRSLFESMRPEWIPHVKPFIEQAMAGRRAEFDFEVISAAGHPENIWATIVPEHSQGPEVDGVLAIFKDNTERDRARRLLAESMHEISELKAALDAHAIVAVTDARGVITRVNDKFCTISKYPRGELVGSTHRLINSGHHPKSFFVDLWKTISSGQVWNGEICNRAKDGSLYWVHTTIVPFIGGQGLPVQYIAIRADITERKRAEQSAQRMALYDALTGLPNRRLMSDRLHQALAASARDGQHGALLLLDLDHFKQVNDSLGHDQGDEMLRQVARRLQASTRQIDTVARMGGDEFVIVLGDLSADAAVATALAGSIADKVRKAVNEPYQLNGMQVDSSPSIGMLIFRGDSLSEEELLKRADMALYQAKELGRDRKCFFDPAHQAQNLERIQLLHELKQALPNEQLRLHYQPVVESNGQVLGYEALLRWQHPGRGMVSPAEFIPLAEQSGLIFVIGKWVLEQACKQLAEWRGEPGMDALTLAVNVSARQFKDPQFVDCVEAALRDSGASPTLLWIELTESMLHSDIDETIAKMARLKRLGVRFSLDDFGTGYSSLSYLSRMPIDQLKIDRSFVRDITCNPNAASIASTIISLASSMNLDVIAEGVESAEQFNLLKQLGCQAFQGYFFGKPTAVLMRSVCAMK